MQGGAGGGSLVAYAWGPPLGPPLGPPVLTNTNAVGPTAGSGKVAGGGAPAIFNFMFISYFFISVLYF